MYPRGTLRQPQLMSPRPIKRAIPPSLFVTPRNHVILRPILQHTPVTQTIPVLFRNAPHPTGQSTSPFRLLPLTVPQTYSQPAYSQPAYSQPAYSMYAPSTPLYTRTCAVSCAL